MIFTDSHSSYKWLKNEGYVHRAVNHKQREFSRTEIIYGVRIVVSTHAAEGLFGRMKAFARARRMKRVQVRIQR